LPNFSFAIQNFSFAIRWTDKKEKIIWPEECVQDTVNVAFQSRKVPRSDRELRGNITYHSMTEKRNSLELEVSSQIFS